jgi:hypothetical protein
MSSSLLNSHCQHPVGPQQMLMIRNNPFWRLVYLETHRTLCNSPPILFSRKEIPFEKKVYVYSLDTKDMNKERGTIVFDSSLHMYKMHWIGARRNEGGA